MIIIPPPHTHPSTPEFEPDAQSELLYTGLDSWRKMPISRALHGKGTQNAAWNENLNYVLYSRPHKNTYLPPGSLFVSCLHLQKKPTVLMKFRIPKETQYETKKLLHLHSSKRTTNSEYSFILSLFNLLKDENKESLTGFRKAKESMIQLTDSGYLLGTVTERERNSKRPFKTQRKQKI